MAIKNGELKVEAARIKQKLPTNFGEGLNNEQLWYIYLGLERLKLVPELKGATSNLAKQVYAIGINRHQWLKQDLI